MIHRQFILPTAFTKRHQRAVEQHIVMSVKELFDDHSHEEVKVTFKQIPYDVKVY